ncbi:MAG TPA: GMC family oxidoreductase [Trebonia sp.]|jgi:choline dehydrogenase-like flavoprotein
MSNEYEFIIIGTGAGGGTIARQLAEAGRKILILERGDFLPQERENWDPKSVFIDGRYVSQDTWYDRHGKAFAPNASYYVGGATKRYGAALFRLRPSDFRLRVSADGISPAWPVSYDDMEPFYSRAEQLYQVHGNHGEDPTEGWWSQQYPYPAVSHSPHIQRISDDLAAAGYHPFHAPSAVLLNESGPGKELPCVRCNTCDGHPCQLHAKADAEVIGIRPVLGLPNVTLVTNAEVVQLGTNITGQRVTRVDVQYAIEDGGTDSFTADTVILAAGAANTAKILLASGIANSSGMVGANFMMHNSRAVLAIDRERNTTVFQKTLAFHDFIDTLGSIQMVGKSCAEAMRGEDALAKLAPGKTLAWVASHAVDFWLTTEDFPATYNRVSLTSGGDIRLSYARNNDRAADGLYRELRTIMNHTGIAAHHVMDRNVFAGMRVPLAGVAHQAGTARMGDDPATSVVDANCKSHDLGNLYIADTSVFPSIGAVNPALTAMANALRVGSHLLEG